MKRTRQIDMLEGPIFGTLIRLALPIVASSVIQMGYNLVDMLWIGKLGSNAVAAVGAAGLFLWMGMSITTAPPYRRAGSDRAEAR